MITTRKSFLMAVFAFGLLAGGNELAQARTDFSSVPYAESFENLAPWGNTYTNVSIAISNGWYSTLYDKSAIISTSYTFSALATCGYPLPAATHTNALSINTTSASLTNSFLTGGLTGTGFDLSTNLTYVDTMVQFVPSPYPPSACVASGNTDNANGIKAAVFANSNNVLQIYCGVATIYGGYVSNALINTGYIVNPTNWYRLTITLDATFSGSLYPDVGDIEMFQIHINGAPLTNSTGFAYPDGWNGYAVANNQLPSPSATGTWFPSGALKTPNNKHLTALVFQGTGFIDDLVVSTAAPVFSPDTNSTFQLTLALTGSGSTDFNGGPGNVSPFTQIPVLYNTSTQIIYTANQWFQIASLTSNGVAVAGAANATVFTQTLSSITAAISNHVTFYQPTNYVTSTLVTNVPGAAGGADHVGAIPVLNGSNLVINYTAAPWSYISGVNSNGTGLGAQASPFALAFGPVTNNMTAQATFMRDSYTISQPSSFTGGSANPSGNITVLNGNTTSITYTASTHWKVGSITSNGSPISGVSGLSSYTLSFGPVIASETADASFYLPTNTVTWTLNLSGLLPAGGPASTVYNVANGDSVTIVVTAQQWSAISDVVNNGSDLGAQAGQSYSLVVGPVVDGNQTASATIHRQPWDILQVIGVNGEASPTDTLFQVANGLTTQIVYSATSTWYTINQLLTNGAAVTAANQQLIYTQTLAQVQGNYSNNVSFYRAPHNVTSVLATNVAGASGSADQVGVIQVLNGDTLTVNYTADLWSYISDVNSNGTDLGGSPGETAYALTLGPVINDLVATGTFSRLSWNITQPASYAGGSASPASATLTVLNGQTTSITYTASTNYKVNTITSNGSPISGVSGLSSYTLSFGPVIASETADASFYLPTNTVTWTLNLSGLLPAGGPASTVYNVANGDSVTIVVTAQQWSAISDVVNNGSDLGAQAGQSYSLVVGPVVDGNQTASATIHRQPWDILQVIGVNGEASPTDTLFQVANGLTTQIVYSATSTWYTINQLLTNGAAVTAANQQLIYTQTLAQVQGNYSNNVSFYRAPHNVTSVLATNVAGASGSADQVGVIQVLNGDTLTVNYTADLWSYISDVNSNGTDLGGSPGETAYALTLGPVINDLVATGTFSRLSWNITQPASYAGGSASPASATLTVLNGQTTSITYTASTNYKVNTITSNGTSVAGVNGLADYILGLGPVTNSMTADASFYLTAALTNTVTWTLNLTGLLPAGGPASQTYYVAAGDPLSIIVTAQQWSAISDVVDNGTDLGAQAGQSYTLTIAAVNSNMTASATIDRHAWNVMQVIGVNGEASPTDTLFLVANGLTTQIVYTATSTWYTINQLLTNGAAVAAANKQLIYTQTLAQVQGDWSNNVSFYRPPWSITQTVGANGSANPAGTVTVLNGDSTNIVYTPSDYYAATAIVGAYGSATTNGAKPALVTATFTQVQGDTTANVTFATVSDGSVVSGVPTSYLINSGVTEAWATNPANTNAVLQGYMLNLPPTGLNPTLAITGITASNTSVNVTVLLDNNSVPTNTIIYGTLRLYGTTNLVKTAFSEIGAVALTGASFTNNGKHVVSFTDSNTAKFYKAKITLP